MFCTRNVNNLCEDIFGEDRGVMIFWVNIKEIKEVFAIEDGLKMLIDDEG